MASVTMNFANTDIAQVARAIGAATGKTIIVDPRVTGQLNLVSENPVSDEVAIKTLESALRMQGFTLLQDHGVIKIVPEADAKLQGVSTYVGNAPVAKGDQVVTQVFHLHRESANSVLPILRPLISPNNTVSAYPGNNTIVVTDYADNIRRIAAVIAGIDAASEPHIDVVQLNFADAATTVPQVQKLLDMSAIGESDPTQKVTVTADPRTNSIVLRSGESERLKEAEALVIKLDTPARTPGNIHIVTLRNADATDIAKTLRKILGQSNSGDSKDGSAQSKGNGAGSSHLSNSDGSLPPLPSIGGTTSTSSGASTTTGASSGVGGASAGAVPNSDDQDGDKGNGEIVADVSTNSLIITASEPVFKNLSTVIARLDQRKVQIYIESLIMEVSSDKTGQFGIQWLTTSGLATLAASTTNVGIVAGFGNILGTKGLFQALQTNSDVNILSTPSLLTLDNHEARILVGTNIPIETGTYSTNTTSSSSASAFNTYDRQDVGIMLDVKPQINQGGTIRLQLYQEDSSVISGTSNNAGGSSINKRALQSTILADDGQIVVLGGLISDSYTNGNSSLPWISKVPLLGYLFRNETKNREKTNLLIFLRPVIVKDASTLANISSDRYGYIRGKSLDYKSENWTQKDDTQPVPPPNNGNQPGSEENLFDLTHIEHKINAP
ncbi:type II secretion system protein GspD [Paraburkholderia caffeinilytica]|uniref:Type II secretion system protein GspD n=2 Tax=Paraburkholderia caffeinilytica TaxID=1761016 RepID=A0ABQ1MIB4_9BURK|nr:type II secretion system protein GspD [Paraburkholderia caffeinilytica]CAB3787498.1 Secretin GspD 2 [Paraburkholderia caffeinilytica]